MAASRRALAAGWAAPRPEAYRTTAARRGPRRGGCREEVWRLAPILAILFGAGVVQGATGFGYVMLAVPLLLATASPRLAVTLAVASAIPVVCGVLWACWRRVDAGASLLLLVGSAAAYPAGVWLLEHAEPARFRTAVVLILVLSALAMLRGERVARRREREGAVAPDAGLAPGPSSAAAATPAITARTEPWAAGRGPLWPALLVGALSGVLNTAVGMGGPPYVLYVARRASGKEVQRATVMFLNLVNSLISVTAFAQAGTLAPLFRSPLLAAAVPAGLAGAWLGTRIFQRTEADRFRQGVLYLVMALSLLDLLQAVRPG